jgi:hypothetical protein
MAGVRLLKRSFSVNVHLSNCAVDVLCCPRCGENLQEGYISGNNHPIRWYKEMPPRSLFAGMALFGFSKEGLWSCFGRKWVSLPAKRCQECNIGIVFIDHTGKDMNKKGVIFDIVGGIIILAVFSAWQIFFQEFLGKIRYEELPLVVVAYCILAILLDFVMIGMGVFIALRGSLRLFAAKGDE